jgi:hypothetical protein
MPGVSAGHAIGATPSRPTEAADSSYLKRQMLKFAAGDCRAAMQALNAASNPIG